MDTRTLAYQALNEAMILGNRRSDEALTKYNEALNLYNKINPTQTDYKRIILLLNNIAVIFFNKQDYSNARCFYEYALAQYSKFEPDDQDFRAKVGLHIDLSDTLMEMVRAGLVMEPDVVRQLASAALDQALFAFNCIRVKTPGEQRLGNNRDAIHDYFEEKLSRPCYLASASFKENRTQLFTAHEANQVNSIDGMLSRLSLPTSQPQVYNQGNHAVLFAASASVPAAAQPSPDQQMHSTANTPYVPSGF